MQKQFKPGIGLALCASVAIASAPLYAAGESVVAKPVQARVSPDEVIAVLKQYRTGLLTMSTCGLDVAPYESLYAGFVREFGQVYGLAPRDAAAADAEAKTAFAKETEWKRERVDCGGAEKYAAALRSRFQNVIHSGGADSLKGWTIQAAIPPEGIPGIRRYLIKGADGLWRHVREAHVTDEGVEKLAINPYTRSIWLDARRSYSSSNANICFYGLLSDVGYAGNDRKKVGLTVCNSQFTTTSTNPNDFISMALLMHTLFGFQDRTVGSQALLARLKDLGFLGITIEHPYSPISYVPITLLPQLTTGTFMKSTRVNVAALRAALEQSGLVDSLEAEVAATPPDASWADVDARYPVKFPDPRDIRPRD